MIERKAWFCPSCQKHHAPHVDTCQAPAIGFKTTPYVGSPYPVPGGAGDVPKAFPASVYDGPL